eukprot:scpid45103/ scgid27993/ Differentially expressed in FDCP 8 homolog
MSKLTSLWRSVTGPGEPLSEEQLRHYDQQRSALLKRSSLAVKQIQLDSCNIEGDEVGQSTQVIKDGDGSSQLMHSFEAILEHGLIEGVLSFGGKPSFWPLIGRVSRKQAVQYLSRLQHVTSSAGRCRAWLRLAANESSLQSYFLVLCNDKDLLREFYEGHAFLLDDDKTAVLCNLLNGVNTISFNLTIDDAALEFGPTADALPADKLRLTALQMQSNMDTSGEKATVEADNTAKADQSLLQQLQDQHRREEEAIRQREEAQRQKELEALDRERRAEQRRQRELTREREEDLEKKLANAQELRLQQERLLMQQREQLEKMRQEAKAAKEAELLSDSGTGVYKTSASPTSVKMVDGGPRPHPRFDVNMDDDDQELVKPKRKSKSKSTTRSASASTVSSSSTGHISAVTGTAAPQVVSNTEYGSRDVNGGAPQSSQPVPISANASPLLGTSSSSHRGISSRQSPESPLRSLGTCAHGGGATATAATGGSDGHGVYREQSEQSPATGVAIDRYEPPHTGSYDNQCGSGSSQPGSARTSKPASRVGSGRTSPTPGSDPADAASPPLQQQQRRRRQSSGTQESHTSSQPVSELDMPSSREVCNDESTETQVSAVTNHDVDDLHATARSLLLTSSEEPLQRSAAIANSGQSAADAIASDETSAITASSDMSVNVTSPATTTTTTTSSSSAGVEVSASPVTADTCVSSSSPLPAVAGTMDESQEAYDDFLARLMRGSAQPVVNSSSDDEDYDPKEGDSQAGHLSAAAAAAASKGPLWFEASVRSEVLAMSPPSAMHDAIARSRSREIPGQASEELTGLESVMGTTVGSYVYVDPVVRSGQRKPTMGAAASDSALVNRLRPGAAINTASPIAEAESDAEDEATDSSADDASSSSEYSGSDGEDDDEVLESRSNGIRSDAIPATPQAPSRGNTSSSVTSLSGSNNTMSPPVLVPTSSGHSQWHGVEESSIPGPASTTEGGSPPEEGEEFVMLSLVDVNDDHFAQPEELGEHATIADVEIAIEVKKKRIQTCEESEKEVLVAEIVQLRLRLLQLVESSSSNEQQKLILGHRFVRKTKKPGSKSTCDRCGAVIWRMVQIWYRCAECHYNCHAKCLGDVSRSCVQEGVDRTPLIKSRTFITEICPERGLGEQQYMCFECRRRIAFSPRRNHLEARLCDYTGKYYCPFCHWNDTAVIPARVIHNWDFEHRKVCRSSLEVLTLTSKRACLSVGDVNSMLYNYVGDLSTVKQLREEILIMKEYFVKCPQARKEKLLRQLDNRQHYVETSHLFSLTEFLELNNGTLLPSLQHISSNFIMHIKVDCEICQEQGYTCTLCHSEEMIFHFDSHCTTCSKCNTLYHRACFQNGTRCQKCNKENTR